MDVLHQVASLISNGNIVAIYQGRSEAGPRALGNRSFLYDPRDKYAKDYVNRVKKRESYRPFAASIMKEHVNDWFDMAGLEESPFMMYAVEARKSVVDIIPGVLHVDGTCRIQTVTKEQNFYYYQLIEKFYELTKVPLVFNTSFNLAGETIVETLDDAIDTMKRCDVKYLYLPYTNELCIY